MVATRRRVVRGPFAPRLVTRWLLLLVLVIVVLVTFWGHSPLHPLLEQPLHKHTSPRVILQSPAQVSDALLASLDAVLVLGGGRPTTLAEPPLYVQRRCDDAATLAHRYAALDNAKKTMTIRMSDKHPLDQLRPAVLPILTLSAGTAHVPQLLAPDGLPIWESTASAAYLAQRYPHIQPQQLYVETVSYDTIGNAYFARTTHTDVNGWHKLLVITNDFHMNRTAAIFDWIFALSSDTADSAATQAYELVYLASPDVGLSRDALLARHTREEASLANVHRYAATYRTSLAQVHHFLTTEHALYTAHTLVERGRAGPNVETTDLEKKSYGGNR